MKYLFELTYAEEAQILNRARIDKEESKWKNEESLVNQLRSLDEKSLKTLILSVAVESKDEGSALSFLRSICKGDCISVESQSQTSGDTWSMDLNPGDMIEFGSYLQNNENVPSAIEWYVLEVKDKKAFLLSKNIIDVRNFYEFKASWEKNFPWDSSDLKEWLNEDFLNTAFTGEQKNMISSEDECFVFCLSWDEFEKVPDTIKRAQVTEYAFGKGLIFDENRNGEWWLFSRYARYKDFVGVDGIAVREDKARNLRKGVRPALWLKLEP